MDLIYNKDSFFDRFVDYLSELLLSYLLICDKFSFECVSKQLVLKNKICF